MNITPEFWSTVLSKATDVEAQGHKFGIADIVEEYNISKYEASIVKAMLENRKIIHNDISMNMSMRKMESTVKTQKSKIENLMNELDEANNRLDFVLQIDTEKKYIMKSFKDEPRRKDISFDVENAVAIAILSDVHIEEHVDIEQVNGLNEYSPEIAKYRVNKFFDEVLKNVQKERMTHNIDTLVLGLLGDFITGYIHEDLKESNSMSPTEATSFVKEILIEGIIKLVDNGNFEKIIIPCTPGNHGRTTVKKRFNTGYKNSYEWMMYNEMKNVFSTSYIPEKYKNTVEFVISKSELVYIKVYDKVIRFGHGDHFSYGGGIGGINVPMLRWLTRINSQKHADMTFIGHWHQILTGPSSNAMVNGSVIGVNAYSMGFGAKEDPKQIFTLLVEDKGFSNITHMTVK